MEWLHALDRAVLEWCVSMRHPRAEIFMDEITALGSVAVLTLVVLFALGLLVARRRFRTTAFVLMAVLGGAALVQGAKMLVSRERPDPALVSAEARRPSSYSFPSGHSALAAVVYLTLAFAALGRIAGRRTRVYVVTSSLLLVFLIGFSRMYLGVHYFTDVFAGWAIGLAWALGCRWLENRTPEVRREQDTSAASP